MSPLDPGTAATIATAARTIEDSGDLLATMSRIVESAHESLPGFEHVGVSTLDRGSRLETRAATTELVHRLDRLQYALGEGPGIDALKDTATVAAPNLRHEQRWPRYVSQAVKHGLRAQLGVRLFLDRTGTIGGLNLYSTADDGIDPDTLVTAEIFAAHAAIALSHATEVASLNEALVSRKLIGQATGIVMERYGLGDEQAFAFLVRTSNQTNVKIRDVARSLVEESNGAGREKD